MNYFTAKSKHVALLVETSSEYGRGLLQGINRFMQEFHSWSIYLREYSRTFDDLNWLAGWKGDGLIARIEHAGIAARIRPLGIPVVDVSASRLLPEVPGVETNDEAIAGLAAAHLLERGFRQFAFYGNPPSAWSQNRCGYFRSFLRGNGFDCRIFDGPSDAAGESGETSRAADDRMALRQWLISLPKPIGIMAAYDVKGLQLLEACRDAGIAVPEEVAVVSVDNDELLCSFADPPLSSIRPDTLTTGYTAASLLHRMMNGEAVEPRMFYIDPLGIRIRQSSDIVAIRDEAVAEAVRFIRKNACSNINVNDVLRVIPVSRRILETRFKKALGHSPHEQIVKVKLSLAKQLLVETELPVSMVAERIGMPHQEYLSVLFKRHTGITPMAYRNQYR